MTRKYTSHAQTWRLGASKRCFQAWWNMHTRCENPHHKSYGHYGGRGITIARAWSRTARGAGGFLQFFLDMGNPPDNYSLDRINVNGGYQKSNCRWSPAIWQARNKRKRGRIEEFSAREIIRHLKKQPPETRQLVIDHLAGTP